MSSLVVLANFNLDVPFSSILFPNPSLVKPCIMKSSSFTIILYLFLLSTIACHSSNNTTSNTTIDQQAYQELSKDQPIKVYVGQKVWLIGKQSKAIYQHMMKGSIALEGESKEEHIYIDYHVGQQIVAYYKDINVPKGQKKYKFYGTIQSMTGAGKGGGTHTEYYINLDKVE